MNQYLSNNNGKVTVKTFVDKKQRKEKISMLTAYDFTMASILDKSGIDCILVGDSASNVVCGNETTLPITIDEMIFCARSVAKAAKRAFVVCDMPFGTYQTSIEEAISNAIKIMKESECDAIKLEGGVEIADKIQGIISAGVPVVGHLGLTPQSIHKFGTYSVRAKEQEEAEKLIKDAQMLCDIGCFAIVLEKIPAQLAAKVTQSVSCSTIGIGAGNATDGQVLVVNDMLGMTNNFSPKFLRRYANLSNTITNAVEQYIADVESGDFPSEIESY